MKPSNNNNDSVTSTLDTWQSYVPEKPLFQRDTPTQQTVFKNTTAATSPPTTNKGSSSSNSRIHSLQDDAWRAAQEATTRLVKRSTEPLGAIREPKISVAPIPVKNEQQQQQPVPQDNVVSIQPLEDVPRRDSDLALFAMEMERRPYRPTQQLILDIPPAVETLVYCAQFKSSTMPWFIGGQKTIAANEDLAPPIVPIYTRAYLRPFMREPDPASTHERPCFNLDREPYEGEQGRVRCIAHRLSENLLGEGYRLRELLNTTQCTQIEAALSRRGKTPTDPREYLSKIPEMCVMCHVWLTTEAALDQKNRTEERKPDEEIAVLNRFMVDIDKPGEYSRHCLLSGDDVAMGIWGPFPLWNERHYRPWKDPAGTGLRGFQELDDMLFRLSLEPSPLQSTRMCVTAAASKSLH